MMDRLDRLVRVGVAIATDQAAWAGLEHPAPAAFQAEKVDKVGLLAPTTARMVFRRLAEAQVAQVARGVTPVCRAEQAQREFRAFRGIWALRRPMALSRSHSTLRATEVTEKPPTAEQAVVAAVEGVVKAAFSATLVTAMAAAEAALAVAEVKPGRAAEGEGAPLRSSSTTVAALLLIAAH